MGAGVLLAAASIGAVAAPDGGGTGEAPPLLFAATLDATAPAARRTRAAAANAVAPAPGGREAPLRLAQAMGPAEDRAGSQPEAPVPLDDVRAPSPVSREAASRQEPDLPDLSGGELRLAPIRWGGNSSTALSWFNDGDGGTTLNNIQATTLRASSHIYQPWFAQVSGNMGFVSGTTKRTLGQQTAPGPGGGDGGSRSNTLTWGGTLNLFPQSRFPLQVYGDTSDSRASGAQVGAQYTATRFGFRQNYRPETGTDNYSLSYDRSVLSGDIGRSVVDSLQGGYSVSLDDQSVSVNTRYAQNTGGLNGESSRLLGLTGSHSWRVHEDLSISTTANLSDNQLRYLSGGRLSENDSRLLQLTSSFFWRPDEDLPLTVNGGGSFLGMATRTDSGSADLSNLSGYVGATYRFSPNLTGSGNFQVARLTSEGLSQLMLAETASLSYSGDPLVFGNFNYNWNTTGVLTNQDITGGLGQRGINLQLGHGLNRSIVFDPGNVLNLNLSQSVSVGAATRTGPTTGLVHSAGTSWRLGYGDRITGSFSVSVSDTLTTGQYANHFQSVNLSANGLAQISRRSGVTVSGNLSWYRQQQENPILQLGPQLFDTRSSRWNGGGAVSYFHRNPFGINNLQYNASLLFTSAQTNQRLVAGDPNAMTWQTSTALMQRLDYRAGRLNFQVLGTVAQVSGKKNASVYFQVSRDFGAL
ncbi:MAG: hypothetical protein JNM82_07175 [Rhodocyclaceae bacterium]|nr:hypothetical protein [Rhodocyclaceae bacterium]